MVGTGVTGGSVAVGEGVGLAWASVGVGVRGAGVADDDALGDDDADGDGLACGVATCCAAITAAPSTPVRLTADRRRRDVCSGGRSLELCRRVGIGRRFLLHAPPDRTSHGRTVGGSTGQPLGVMQDVRELVPEDGEADDEDHREEHHA